MNDNKTLRSTHTSCQFVIMVMRCGVLKFVDRRFSKHMNYTVLLNRAKRFQSEKQALEYARVLGIEDRCNIVPVIVEMRLEVEK